METNKRKGKDTFTKAEIDQLRQLIIELSSLPVIHDPRKKIRNKIRSLGFYASNWSIRNMKEANLDRLIKEKRINVI